MSRLFDRYDGPGLAALFDEAGVLEALRDKGFGQFDVAIADAGVVWPHVLLRADKAGRTYLLLDACLRRLAIAAPQRPSTSVLDGPLDLLLVSWMREEDPTTPFVSARPPLPLQTHPGLGVLRRAFGVVVRIAADLESDGIANQPKFFHDAVIFHRAAQFLFLDGHEQGRFEALRRDVSALPLRDASLAVAGWCVRDSHGRVVRWTPGYQVFPLSSRLSAYLQSSGYAAEVAAARHASRFCIDIDALESARAQCREVSA